MLHYYMNNNLLFCCYWRIYCDINILYLSNVSHTRYLLQFLKTKFIFKKSNGLRIGMYFCF